MNENDCLLFNDKALLIGLNTRLCRVTYKGEENDNAISSSKIYGENRDTSIA